VLTQFAIQAVQSRDRTSSECYAAPQYPCIHLLAVIFHGGTSHIHCDQMLVLTNSKGIFGMTQFKLETVWYPIGAVIALLTTTILWALSKYITKRSDLYHQPNRKSLLHRTRKFSETQDHISAPSDPQRYWENSDSEFNSDGQAEEDEEQLYQETQPSVHIQNDDDIIDSDTNTSSEGRFRERRPTRYYWSRRSAGVNMQIPSVSQNVNQGYF
jgi:hypothetical protein